MSENLLIYGATSAIVQGVAKQFAKEACNFVLVARQVSRLDTVKQDLTTRGAGQIYTINADLNDFSSHDRIWNEAKAKLGTIHRVIIGYGTLGTQSLSEKDYHTAEMELKTNFLSCVSILTPISNHMEADGSGQIAVISSVAGDRGRKSNFIYGAAKAGLSAYLSGLRQRLSKSGVNVLTIKPGFVDSPMTSSVTKNALFVSPEKVGSHIHKAMKQRKDIIYTPPIWFFIMLIIKLIPETIFKRLPL